MKTTFLDLLKCPCCGSTDLEIQAEAVAPDGDVTSGRIHCRAGGESFPVVNGIPRMLANLDLLADTKAKFEFQWKTWGKEEVIFGRTLEQTKAYIIEQIGMGIDASWFKGKRVLDAGCGHGMYVQAMAEMGAEVSVGLDLGVGIEAARQRNAGYGNVALVQGNLLQLPFRDGVFDLVFCNGVAHHTPDPKEVTRQLCAATKSGGYANLWLYPKGSAAWEISQTSIRAITTRLPPAVLHVLTYLAVPLLYVAPTYSNTSPRTHSWKHCAQVIYDWYSPKYQSHHTNEEVIAWMKDFGCVATSVQPLTVTVTGRLGDRTSAAAIGGRH